MPFYISSHFLLAHPLPSSYLISTFLNIYTLTSLYLTPIICFLVCIIFSNILTTSTPISLYLAPIFSTLIYPYVPPLHPHIPLHHPHFFLSLHSHIQCYLFFPIYHTHPHVPLSNCAHPHDPLPHLTHTHTFPPTSHHVPFPLSPHTHHHAPLPHYHIPIITVTFTPRHLSYGYDYKGKQ